MPSYNSVFRYLEAEALTPYLYELIKTSSLPLKSVEHDFAVDSSGFSTGQFIRWMDVKYGKEEDRRMWLKVHLMCGVKTNIITSVEISDGYGERPRLISESKSRNRTPFVNSKNDLPVFRIKHSVDEVRALRIPTLSRSALIQGAAFPPASPRGGDTLCPTLWAMFGLIAKLFHVTELRQRGALYLSSS